MYERSYHTRVLNRDDAPKAPKQKKLPIRIRVSRKSILIGVITLVLIVGIGVVVRLPKFQVKTVEVEGTHVADPVEVSQFVANRLQGNTWYVFPRSSIVALSTRRLAREIKTAFPRFKEVDVDRIGATTLRVGVEEYGGVYLWCENPESCFFMDERGVVFAEAPFFSGNAYTKVFIGSVGELPFTALTVSNRALLELLLTRLHAIMIKPDTVRFVAERELVITFVHHGKEAKIIIDPTLDPEQTLEALFTAMRTQSFATKFDDKSRSLEYIDLRFAHKVVYRFYGQAPAPEPELQEQTDQVLSEE